MEMRRKEEFLGRWRRYFGGAELPIACWYTDDEGAADRAEPGAATGAFSRISRRSARGRACGSTSTRSAAAAGSATWASRRTSCRISNTFSRAASRASWRANATRNPPGSTLSFAVPMNKFAAMIADMDESFLITKSWEGVRRRMG